MKETKERTDVLVMARQDGSRLAVAPPKGLTVAQVMFLHQGGPVKPLCGGIGRCGRCAARFVAGAPRPDAADLALFSPDELADGLRLTCRHPALPGMVVEEPASPREFPIAPPAQQPEPGVRCAPQADALAVDLGTTSLHWAALGADGTILAQGAEPNPQLGAGSEIMSRLAFALAGHAGHLRGLVLERLRALHAACGRPPRLVVAGNPTMTALLLAAPLDGLARAPYRLDEPGGREVRLADDLPPCLVPPQFGPFVGGDVSAGIIALESAQATGERPAAPWILADFGTNGEFALALPDGRLILTSVPMGPALEGVGLSRGCLAGPGAATGFALTPAGLAPQVLGPWDGPALRGLSGTGAVSLLAQLRRAGALDAQGRFMTGNTAPAQSGDMQATPLAARLLAGLGEKRGETALFLPGQLSFSASDMEEVLKVKAACNLAFSRLLGEAGLAPQDVSALFLAGALGSHAQPADLAELGFIPPRLAARASAAGNTSLAGARLLALSQAAREAAAALPGRARVIDLTASADYGSHFIQRMRFEYVP